MNSNHLLTEYGFYLFNDDVMKERIPSDVYKAFKEAVLKKESMSKDIAAVIAKAMKEWALEKGATHFTHWFTPLNGHTAEKHDAFLELDGDKPLLEFSGKLLRKGEPDASSFPTGGLRATFEARGYTAWDCTSPAFVKNHTLYIPTLFCSYTGESLDHKTPLLKSCEILNKEAVKLLKLLDLDVNNVESFVGAEQEYFLVLEEYFQKRLDLKFTGRTLFGLPAPKGQELEDHYFGSIKQKVAEFMQELDYELWKYGVPSKTKHNETAPAQHEVACIYRNVNITTDNNNLLMQLAQDIALKHGLRCLLHEKPFAGINGSGKHNNWSVITNTGVNLFKPGSDPINNTVFLASLACVIKGVSEYADLLSLSIASPSNDLRLGGNEAPPAIISLFLGDELEAVINAVLDNKKLSSIVKNRFQTGVNVVFDFAKDNTDRNRTSPFAFTGNKFEFRGVGSSQSIAFVNTMLNAILAKEMREMTTLISSGMDVLEVIKSFISEHKRVIFGGDGYSRAWEVEAKKRGLSNLNNTVDALGTYKNEKMRSMLVELGVFSEIELDSRYNVLLENYCKTIHVESLTAIKMVKSEIYPAGLKYLGSISNVLISLRENHVSNSFVLEDVVKLSNLLETVKETLTVLEDKVNNAECMSDLLEKSRYYRDEVITLMNKLRTDVDSMEEVLSKEAWPIPTYTDLLFGI